MSSAVQSGRRYLARPLAALAGLGLVPSLLASGLKGSTFAWPQADAFWQVLTLADYNTRVVVVGTALLGMAAGLIGTFMLLRKRSLLGDAISHATLPGIGIAFLLMVALGPGLEAWVGDHFGADTHRAWTPALEAISSGKFLPGLLLGATIAGLLGAGSVLAIRATTKLKEDAALGIVLSVFFGLGIAILKVVQDSPHGSAAGLEAFIYGKTASMLASDRLMILVAAALVLLCCLLLFKEFALLCFDQHFARAQGFSVFLLDASMMLLVVAVTVIGLQAVGLILVIAMLIIPPASARFWTDHLRATVFAAAGIGAVSGYLGAGMSALFEKLPAGAVIVLVAGGIFAISLVFGRRRGLLVRLWQRLDLHHRIARQNLLRAIYEDWEIDGNPGSDVSADWEHLAAARSWSPSRLQRLIASARRRGELRLGADQRFVLTAEGRREAERLVRNHRLWEIFLITHADIATSRVDRAADRIEHVLGDELVARLEQILAEQHPQGVPGSPHDLAETTGSSHS